MQLENLPVGETRVLDLGGGVSQGRGLRSATGK